MNRKRTSDEKEELIQRISQAEAKAQECQIEAAVYRRQLEKCERLARRAEKTNNPSLLYGVLSQASLTLKKRNVSEWGELWKEASNRDKRRLSEVRKALKEVDKQDLRSLRNLMLVTDCYPGAVQKVP